jgi:ATP-dependent Clp protease ATP-binding subunit ClpA
MEDDQIMKLLTNRSWSAVQSGLNVAASERIWHDEFMPCHLLYGLSRDPRSLAGCALAEVGMTERKILLAIKELLPAGSEEKWPLPYHESTKWVVRFAWGEARELRHERIGTEHLLLALTGVEKPDKVMEWSKITSTRAEEVRGLIMGYLDAGPEEAEGNLVAAGLADLTKAVDRLAEAHELQALASLLDRRGNHGVAKEVYAAAQKRIEDMLAPE